MSILGLVCTLAFSSQASSEKCAETINYVSLAAQVPKIFHKLRQMGGLSGPFQGN